MPRAINTHCLCLDDGHEDDPGNDSRKRSNHPAPPEARPFSSCTNGQTVAIQQNGTSESGWLDFGGRLVNLVSKGAPTFAEHGVAY